MTINGVDRISGSGVDYIVLGDCRDEGLSIEGQASSLAGALKIISSGLCVPVTVVKLVRIDGTGEEETPNLPHVNR